MSSMICGKCDSESTYYQGGGYACMMCGNRSPSRWGFHRKGEQIKAPDPIEESAPILEDEEIEQEEEIDMPSKKGTCEGCNKVRTLLAHNKCYTCNGYGENKKTASGGGA